MQHDVESLLHGHFLHVNGDKNLIIAKSNRVDHDVEITAKQVLIERHDIARIVSSALQEFDGARYRLFAWCIMPNHVHVAFRPLPGHSLANIMHSWKSFTAKQANRLLGKRGVFWQREYYDHIIKDENELRRVAEYILGNPIKAGLSNWPWVWPDPDRTAAVPGASRPRNGRQDACDTAGEDAGDTTTFGPEDVFNYMYAIFHSPTYRERYAAFLKIDFPRLQLTSDAGLFRTLCALGGELLGLHLMESPELDHLITSFPVPGSHIVEKGHPKYLAPGEPEPGAGEALQSGRVYISKDSEKTATHGQYFEGVAPEVWEFHVGGYQVCEKWLKDRRGRALSHDDLLHYQKIVVALKETIRLTGEIDAAISQWPIP